MSKKLFIQILGKKFKYLKSKTISNIFKEITLIGNKQKVTFKGKVYTHHEFEVLKTQIRVMLMII